MTDRRSEVVALVREQGYERREQPFKLASGQLSHDYIDGKYAVRSAAGLRLASEAVLDLAYRLTDGFTAVGGPTMGADALAVGVALAAGCNWFFVRKEPKSRGREQWIEGERLSESDRVLLVEDVVTTGGSMLRAYERIVATGATVAAAIALVDRGDSAARKFKELGVPYGAVVTYADLGIEPVGEPEPAPAAQ
jgi:orotate phosphoribosyltransferase